MTKPKKLNPFKISIKLLVVPIAILFVAIASVIAFLRSHVEEKKQEKGKK